MPQHIRCGIFCFIRKSLFDLFEALHSKLFYSKLFIRLFEALQSCDIFAENIEFDIHHGSYFDVAEVGVLSGVRDDGYGEGVVGWLAYGERNAVHGYAALIYGEVAFARHLLVQFIFEGEVGRTVCILHVDALGGFIHVSLHDMAVQSAVHNHRALHVHLVAHLQQTEVASIRVSFMAVTV